VRMEENVWTAWAPFPVSASLVTGKNGEQPVLSLPVWVNR
jgi:hypothetical protein